MSTGPLRRAIGLAGLVALAPVLLQLATGSITPEDAAVRGTVIAVTVVLLGRAASFVVERQLRRMERRAEDREAGPAVDPTRRQHP